MLTEILLPVYAVLPWTHPGCSFLEKLVMFDLTMFEKISLSCQFSFLINYKTRPSYSPQIGEKEFLRFSLDFCALYTSKNLITITKIFFEKPLSFWHPKPLPLLHLKRTTSKLHLYSYQQSRVQYWLDKLFTTILFEATESFHFAIYANHSDPMLS